MDTRPKIAGLELLSPRESQTLARASKGLTDKEIAVRLGVSLTTIRTYWERVFMKTGAVNRASAVAMFVRGRTQDVPGVPDKPLEPDTLLQAAVDATLGGILVLSPERNIETANEKAYTLLNRVPATLEGACLDSVIPKRYSAFYRVLSAAMEAEEESVYTVSAFVRVTGRTDLLSSVTIRTLDGPEGRHTVLFIQDLVADIDARRRGRTAITV